jgi:alkylated DNA repair protein alkB homolog 6
MPGNDSSFRYLNDNIVLFPDWIAESTESYLLDKFTNAPKSKFVTLSNRRLQLWGCQPASDSSNESTPMIYQKLPDYLHSLAGKIDRLGILSAIPNQCLANEYLCKQGIMPHEDGPIFYPSIFYNIILRFYL